MPPALQTISRNQYAPFFERRIIYKIEPDFQTEPCFPQDLFCISRRGTRRIRPRFESAPSSGRAFAPALRPSRCLLPNDTGGPGKNLAPPPALRDEFSMAELNDLKSS